MPKISFVSKWQNFHTIIFDFDGVFTDNKVYVDENGKETIKCDRADGLALDILRKFKEKNNWEIDYFILSKEKNSVVQKRSEKLKIKCYRNIGDKKLFIKNYLIKRFSNYIESKEGVIYVGNDLNDLSAIQLCGFSIAPFDAHHIIKSEVSIVLQKKGGDGFVREVIERIINFESMTLEKMQEFL